MTIKVTIKKATGNKAKQFTNSGDAHDWIRRQLSYCKEIGQKVFGYDWEKTNG